MRTFHLTILAFISASVPYNYTDFIILLLIVMITHIIPMTMACKNVSSQYVEPSQTPPSSAVANIFYFPAVVLIQSQAITKLASSNG